METAVKTPVVASEDIEKELSAEDLTTVKKPREVEVIPRELANRHPLQSRWVLWYLKGDRHKDWEECLKLVSVFDTVEEFWA